MIIPSRESILNLYNQHLEGVDVPVELAVVSGLDVAPMVLVEVGQTIVHEDVALENRGGGS